MSNKKLAYLVEPVYMSNAGAIFGTSIRCYEVDLYSTSKEALALYTYKKDNTIKRKSTKAKLEDKWVLDHTIHTSMHELSSHRAIYFSTPELAIAAKLQAIHRLCSIKLDSLKTIERNVTQAMDNLPSLTKLKIENPEFFV